MKFTTDCENPTHRYGNDKKHGTFKIITKSLITDIGSECFAGLFISNLESCRFVCVFFFHSYNQVTFIF